MFVCIIVFAAVRLSWIYSQMYDALEKSVCQIVELKVGLDSKYSVVIVISEC